MPDSESQPPSGGVDRPKPQVPDHELIRRIGEGAYGEVWLARSVVGTYRAVKVVYRDSFKDSRPYEREYRGIQKFEPISRSNDGFVDILQIGRNDEAGHFYYVMELADGVSETASVLGPERSSSSSSGMSDSLMTEYSPKTLRSEIERRRRLPFDECLPLTLSLTLALGHLHRHGLLHRDIKPSNIIFVGGVPKLADIGLVTEIEEARSFVGTEGFVAPEGPNTPQSDIYSLGKVLYEMSMGKDRLDFPEPFTALGQSADSAQLEELNAVIVKACAPYPRDRYESAEEMHVDLALLQNGRSVKFRRVLERRLALAIKASVLVGMIAALALGSFLYQRHQTREATRLRRLAEGLAVQMQIKNAENLFERGDSSAALAHLARVLRDHPDHRVAADRLVAALTQRNFPRLASRPFVQAVRFPLNSFLATDHRRPACFSPDGRRILTMSKDFAVHLWSSETGEELIPPHRHDEEIYSAEFNPTGTRIVTASDDRTAQVVDAHTGGLVFAPLRHDRAVLHATFSPDGRWIATACLDGTARLFDAETGQLVRGPLAHVGRMNMVAFSPDSRRLATAMAGGRIRIWDVESAQELHHFQFDGPAQLVRFSPDGRWIAATLYGRHANGIWRVQVWNTESGEAVTGPLLHQNRVYSLEFSPDSQRLVTATANNVARVWEVATGREVFQLPHSSIVYSASYSPDGRQILTGSVDHTARLWDALSGAAISEAMPHEGRVIHAEFSRDGSRLLTAGWEDRTVKVWIGRTPPKRPTILPHPGPVVIGEFDATGREAVTATGSWVLTAARVDSFGHGPQTIAVWDVSAGTTKVVTNLPPEMEVIAAQFTRSGPKALIARRQDRERFSRLAQVWDLGLGTPVGETLQHTGGVTCAHFSADGLTLATGGEDGLLSLWDARSGVALTAPLAQSGRLKAVRFSPDATRVIATTDLGWAVLWDVATGQRVAGPLEHSDGVWCAQFSSQGDKVVTASLDFTAKVWLTNGTLLATLPHPAAVEYAEFSPDGSQVATASGREARLWKVTTGRQLIEPLRHAELVMTARFSGDGLRLITASKNKTAQLWDVKTGLKLADPFDHSEWVISAAFSPHGHQAISGSLDRTAKVWNVPVAPSPIPAWLPELAEVIGGRRLSSDQIPEPVTWDETVEAKARLPRLPSTDPLAAVLEGLSSSPGQAEAAQATPPSSTGARSPSFVRRATSRRPDPGRDSTWGSVDRR